MDIWDHINLWTKNWQPEMQVDFLLGKVELQSALTFSANKMEVLQNKMMKSLSGKQHVACTIGLLDTRLYMVMHIKIL